MKKSIVIILVLLAFILGMVSGSANFYNGYNIGVSWDRGGIELSPDTGIFLCDANYDIINRISIHYNWPDFLDFMIADC